MDNSLTEIKNNSTTKQILAQVFDFIILES
jgi:hypothetical protein